MTGTSGSEVRGFGLFLRDNSAHSENIKGTPSRRILFKEAIRLGYHRKKGLNGRKPFDSIGNHLVKIEGGVTNKVNLSNAECGNNKILLKNVRRRNYGEKIDSYQVRNHGKKKSKPLARCPKS